MPNFAPKPPTTPPFRDRVSASRSCSAATAGSLIPIHGPRPRPSEPFTPAAIVPTPRAAARDPTSLPILEPIVGPPLPGAPWTPRLERHRPAARLRLRRRQLCRRMAELGWRVSGLDVSPLVAQSIRDELGLEIHLGTLPHPDLSPGSFDVVTMWQSLEHVHEPLAVLRAAYELLSPGGRIVVAVPNYESFAAKWFGEHWFGLDLPRHLTHFTRRHSRPDAARGGLSRRSGSRPRALSLAPGRRVRTSGASGRSLLCGSSRTSASRASRPGRTTRSASPTASWPWPNDRPDDYRAWHLSNRAPAPRPGCCRRPGSP